MGTADHDHLRASLDDPSRFEPIVLRHHDAIHRYISRRVGERFADDLTADVFTAAFAGRGGFDPDRGEVRPWLFGIATNLLRKHRRDELRLLDGIVRSRPGDPGDDDAGDLGIALAAALAGMRRQHRDALLLHALAELSYEEVAAAMGVPIGTVRSWLHRARAVASRELTQRGLGRRPMDEPVTSTTPEAADR